MLNEQELICRRYAEAFGAAVTPIHSRYLASNRTSRPLAALGYTRASEGPLFLERYLDEPIETAIGRATGRYVTRERIVELGNLASCDSRALVRLWHSAANELSGSTEFAAATLTAPLRAMFARMGLPFTPIVLASHERAGSTEWGRYYELDPWVCVGDVDEGRAAIEHFINRRHRRTAA